MRILMRAPSSLACVVFLISLAGCTDGPTPPGSSREVLLPLAVVLPAEAGSFVAAVDRWRVQVVRVTAGVIAEQSGSFSPGQQSTEVSISVSLEERCEELRIRIELYAGNALYFVGEVVLPVCAGGELLVQDVPMMPGPGLPDADLVVTGLTHSPSQPTSDEPVTVMAVVGNQALRGAGPSVLWIRLETEITPVAFSVPALAGGETFQVQRELGPLPPGSYVVTAIANATSTVTESDETNNRRTDSLSVIVAPRPDLVVSTLTHSPAGPTTETSVTVTAVVRNDGGALAGASVLRLQLDGGSATTHDVPSLAPGGTHQVQRVLGTLSAGTPTVTATADVNGTVPESDEGNNQATHSFSVTLVVPPQLSVSTDSLAFWSPLGGTPAEKTFLVRNAGGGTLTWSHSITDTGGCVSSVSLSPASGSLGPGASVAISGQIQGSCPLGTNVSNRSFTISGSDDRTIPFTLSWLVVPSLSPATWDPTYYVSGVNTCTLPAGTGSWFTIHFDFEDREGDVGAGISTVNVSYRFSTGTTGSYSHPPGDPYISYSGTGYAGTVRTDPCYRFGSATYVDLTLTLVDGGGHASNPVTVRMAKPDGAMAPFPAASSPYMAFRGWPRPGGLAPTPPLPASPPGSRR